MVIVVYVNPADHPGKVVVRRFAGEVPEPQPLVVADSYLRAMIDTADARRGLVRFNRAEDDDRCIKEVWL